MRAGIAELCDEELGVCVCEYRKRKHVLGGVSGLEGDLAVGASYLSTFSRRVVLDQFHGCRSTVASFLLA